MKLRFKESKKIVQLESPRGGSACLPVRDSSCPQKHPHHQTTWRHRHACTQNKLLLVKCIRLALVLFTFILNNINTHIIYINIQIKSRLLFSSHCISFSKLNVHSIETRIYFLNSIAFYFPDSKFVSFNYIPSSESLATLF